ncbi:hypothetical protein [Cellulomonas sp. URHB0016]
MSDDIRNALHRFADAELRVAEAARPDPGAEVGVLTRRVARRRTVRTGVTALGVVALVGAVAVGVQAWDGPTTPPPAHPAPTATSTPTATRSTSPTQAPPSPTATPAVPEVEPSTFRDAPPMAPGMLAAAGAGWHVVQYHPLTQQQEDILPTTLYLVSPEGRAYVVPTPEELSGSELLDWLPGTSLAVVRHQKDGLTHVLDLITGTAGPSLALWGDVVFVGDGSDDVLGSGRDAVRRLGRDGSVVAELPITRTQYGTSAWVVSPDRTRLVVNEESGPRAVDTREFAASPLVLPYPDRPDACRAWMWVDDEQVLLQCAAGGTDPYNVGIPSEFWVAPTGGGPAWQITGLEPTRTGGVWHVGDRLVAGMFGHTEATASWFDVTDGHAEPLGAGGDPGLWVFDVHESRLLAMLRPYGSGADTSSIVSVDPVTGTVRPLVVGEPSYFTGFGAVPDRFAFAPQTEGGD